jgi:hypothetical protein
VPAPDIGSGTIPVPGLVAVSTYDNSDYVRGYIQTWNVTIEQRVKGWLTSAAYVASRAIDPQNNLQMNWSPINGGTAGERLNLATGRTASTQFIGSLGTNTYDSLQTRAQRRFNGGYQVNLAYTFSKALGYAITPAVNIPQYFGLNRGPQGTDITHMFSANLVADVPFGKGKRWAQKGVASMLAGGWKLSAIVVDRTGYPFTATASTATLNAPFSNQFADCLAPARKIGDIFQWYDRTAFAPPSAGRFGTCGTNSLRGPGLFNTNVGVNRSFRRSERIGLEFRADMFNIANTPHHSLGNTSVNSGTFLQAVGIINTGLEGIEQRAVRFSLRLSW